MHIGGDIGDGDGDAEAAAIGRVVVGLGVDSVIMVAGIGRIDGDERQPGQIVAAASGGGPKLRRLGQHRRRKLVGDGVLVNGDERDVALVVGGAEALADPRGEEAAAAVLDELGLDQLARLRAMVVAGPDPELGARLLVGRHDAEAVGLGGAEHADDPVVRLDSLRMMAAA